ncbi:hypothetical protein ACIFOT_27830 [Neobacillus sp. NRS-1170]|uniref:hypothetical protein n=1 Tax=Neobacillus sp. NRS-1170 TaxID=3233898 RepID=UPI003D2DBCA0
MSVVFIAVLVALDVLVALAVLAALVVLAVLVVLAALVVLVVFIAEVIAVEAVAGAAATVAAVKSSGFGIMKWSPHVKRTPLPEFLQGCSVSDRHMGQMEVHRMIVMN